MKQKTHVCQIRAQFIEHCAGSGRLLERVVWVLHV